ncbi:MAG: class A beta-lactamase-related serine hydrolase [Betaproteobacteria bacterium]|nr:class A beta-lactamase-related serine hydrolase [Betaproteobacteria bacterium]
MFPNRLLTLILAAWLLYLPAFAAPLPEATPESTGMSSERLQRLTQVMQKAIDKDDLPGVVVMLARNGKLVYSKGFGMQDKARAVPMRTDSIFRAYSMTKPVVSVAAMILVEEGKLTLQEPISKYLPEFKEMKVGVETTDPATGKMTFSTVPAKRPITVQDLLRHTSGMPYGVFTPVRYHVQNMYKEANLFSPTLTLDAFSKAVAQLPLCFEPGTSWEYGHSSDILGRVVEVASGQSLDVFLQERIFAPLKMTDTAFHVPPEKQSRIAQPQIDPATGKAAELLDVTKPPAMFAGGHGLVSTAGDYLRFAQMLANGGELEGARILGPKTVAYMASDHVGDKISQGSFFIPGPGYGFGLGFGVRKDTGLSQWPSSVGEFNWGGYAGTAFWVDPKEQLVPVMMMQSPEQRVQYRILFRSLVYQSLMK